MRLALKKLAARKGGSAECLVAKAFFMHRRTLQQHPERRGGKKREKPEETLRSRRNWRPDGYSQGKYKKSEKDEEKKKGELLQSWKMNDTGKGKGRRGGLEPSFPFSSTFRRSERWRGKRKGGKREKEDHLAAISTCLLHRKEAGTRERGKKRGKKREGIRICDSAFGSSPTLPEKKKKKKKKKKEQERRGKKKRKKEVAGKLTTW